MGDTLNIHDLLQTGYFTTSRARTSSVTPAHKADSPSADRNRPSPQPATSPIAEHDTVERTIPRAYEESRSYSRSPRPSQPRPPPPTVEDEVESLAKEHGSPTHTVVDTEQPQNRGDFQQESVLEDVPEFNPERRFVFVPKSDSSGEEGEANVDRKRENRRRRDTITDPSIGGRRQPLKTESSTDEDASGKRDRRDASRREGARGADHRSERRHEPVFDDRSTLNVDERPGMSRRSSERRKSRQDLPRIDTGLMPENPKQRPRTKSAVGGPRPDFFDSKTSRIRDERDDDMLSPDVVKHGHGRRGDRQYHRHGYSAGSDARPSYPRSFSNSADERDRRSERDEGSREYYSKGRASPTSTRRSSAHPKSNKDDRRAPGERSSDGRRREEPPSSSRSHRRENSKSSYHDEDARRGPSTGRSREPGPPREDSRSSDEPARGPNTSARRRRESVIIQDERRSAPNFGTSGSGLHSSRDRDATVPLASPTMSSSSEFGSSRNGHSDPPASGKALAAGAAAAALGTAAVGAGATPRASNASLPYPEDDAMTPQLPQIKAPDDLYALSPSDTEPTQERDGGVRLVPGGNGNAEFNSNVIVPSPTTSNAPSNHTWEPGSFVPDRDGLPVDRPIGSYRRYSENQDASGPPRLPECRFTQPLAGSSAWLTLPRSDFNICTECYTAVFADTSYRTQFQPMLYSAERPIACDFGASPWYRIAWLLTLRSEIPDLRYFYSVSQIATLCQAQPCPGDRKTVRTWLTILDPQYRAPLRNFTVCYQCAKTVEALLPELEGIFVPWDPRSEPTKATCALRYNPPRAEFVLYFDMLEVAAEHAHNAKSAVDLAKLSSGIETLSLRPDTCPKDNPVRDGYWHSMQYLQSFTVCGHCFAEVVTPKIDEQNLVARNFVQRPLVYKEATCQLYSNRMRDVFRRACRKEDFSYLESRVKERIRKEHEIHRELERLDRRGHDSAWVSEQVKLLVDEWKEWE